MTQAVRPTRFLDRIAGVPVGIAVLVWLCIAVLDWVTGFEVYFGALYMLFVLAVVWGRGLRAGLIACMLSVANQAAIAIILGNPFSSPFYLGVELSGWLLAYLITCGMLVQIRRLNVRVSSNAVDLEHRVRQRTASLETANEEMRAFSNSVAHDLRAPLLAINSISAPVSVGSGEEPGASSSDRLGRIHAASQHMSALIDDLLYLTQVPQRAMHMSTADLSGMAEEVVASLQVGNPGRSVSVTIRPGMTALCDPAFIRVALRNLIGNAWKFTAMNAAAEIEVGSEDGSGHIVYYVRDNGAGFDMAGANRLFAPFGRLHGDSEFAGNGIGLATVKLIVERHGGEVWIDSLPNQGTEVFFYLGDAGHHPPKHSLNH